MPVSASTQGYGQVQFKNLILWIFVLGAIGIAGYALFVALSASKDKSSDADVQKAIEEALQGYVQTKTLNNYVKADDDAYVKTNDAIFIVGTAKCDTTGTCGTDGHDDCTAQLTCGFSLPLIGDNNIQAVFQDGEGSGRFLKIVKAPPTKPSS